MSIELTESPRVYEDSRGLNCKAKDRPVVYAYGVGRDYVSLNWSTESVSGGICITPAEARKLATMLEGAADLAEGLARLPEGEE